MSASPITEDDLNAFVDHALEGERHAEVVAYLQAHPDVAKRIAGYCEQREQLRAALAPIAEEPLPPELNLSRLIAERRRPRPARRWAMAAAAVLLLSVGGTGGWVLRDMGLSSFKGLSSSRGLELIAQEAADSYLVYAADRARPVEIRAENRPALAQWAQKHLGRPVAIPDLETSGYRFMGGRIVPTNHGPAAMFMYDDDKGTRLVMLARPMADGRDLPMSPFSSGDVNGYAWNDNGLGYSLVGPVEAARLHPTADEARRQLKASV